MEDTNFRPAVSLLYYWNIMRCEEWAKAEGKHDGINITQHDRQPTVSGIPIKTDLQLNC